jgi:hypothetical protein
MKDELSRKFEMKDLGNLHFFLGMEVERDRARLFYINQIEYLKEILKHFHMKDSKAIEVPHDPKTKLKNNVNKDDEMVKVPYQQHVGSLMYAMLCTRLDLAYPISMVSQHMSKPKTSNYNQAHFSILARHLQFNLQFKRLPNQEMVGYCDEDWAGDPEDKKSTTWFVFMMGGEVISWSSK